MNDKTVLKCSGQGNVSCKELASAVFGNWSKIKRDDLAGNGLSEDVSG
jgi:hypothetical protein